MSPPPAPWLPVEVLSKTILSGQSGDSAEEKSANALRTGGKLGFCVCVKIKTHFFEVFVSDGV
ncbi:hypothetical protein, partial [Acetobacter persici]|uniref:hypothetical protein n=1 Tax=Acetobacter persici TaxID=1076596 RepID=UPI001C501DC9